MSGITTSTLSAETGFELAIQKNITWTIKKFSTVLQNDTLIKSQELLFDLEECRGVPPTKWKLFLSVFSQTNQYNLFHVPSTSKTIEVRYAPNPDTGTSTEPWKTNVRIMHMIRGCFLDKDWKEQNVSETNLKEYSGPSPSVTRHGSCRILNIPNTSKLPLIDDNLVLQFKFNIYREAERKIELKGNWIMPKVQNIAEMRNRNLLASGEYSDIKIISKDGQEFPAHKLILRGNEVFDAMFRADMIESMTDIIHLDDMSSGAVKFLLHYIYNFEILPFSLYAEVAENKLTVQSALENVDGDEEGAISNDGPQAKRSRLETELTVSLDEVLYVASKYGLGDLRSFAEQRVEQWCDESNALHLYDLCKKYTLGVKDYVKAFIKNNAALLDELLERD